MHEKEYDMKFLKKPSKLDLEQSEQILYMNWKFVLKTLLILLSVMSLSALAIFFIVVKSPEQVLVPDVVGKTLTDALLEMQIKELYPEIQLQYSDSVEQKGRILKQIPSGGAIVKAGRRINLTVSEGILLDRVGNYIGMQVDEVRMQLQTLFVSSSVPMIQISDIIAYNEDVSEAGTIIEQYPLANTNLSQPIILNLIVSSGPDKEVVQIPNIAGLSLNDALLQMSQSKILFDFEAQVPEEGQVSGTILSQKWPVGAEMLPAYSRVSTVIAIPVEPVDDLVYGLLEERLPPYPYALPVELTASPVEGDDYLIVAFDHVGGLLTIPYAVPQNMQLTLTVLGNEVRSFIVN